MMALIMLLQWLEQKLLVLQYCQYELSVNKWWVGSHCFMARTRPHCTATRPFCPPLPLSAAPHSHLPSYAYAFFIPSSPHPTLANHHVALCIPTHSHPQPIFPHQLPPIIFSPFPSLPTQLQICQAGRTSCRTRRGVEGEGSKGKAGWDVGRGRSGGREGEDGGSGSGRREGEGRGKMMLYIFKWINQQLNQLMKREEKSTPVSSKTRSIYKYELQATNQILKDTLDIYPSSLHSTAQTTRHQNAHLEQSSDYLCDQNQTNKYFPGRQQTHSLRRNHLSHRQNPLNSSENHIEDNDRPAPTRCAHLLPAPKIDRSSALRASQQDPAPLCSFSSDNEDAPLALRGGVSARERGEEEGKELRRQRRGLAHISLKVKNIVAKRGKMSFKEVSDEVLRESMKDLPSNLEQREKEMKNIRRRVYDALNVLVSVGILGKEQRCVVHTEMTNIPGKKLSAHWELITQKKRLLEEQESNYQQKLKNFNLLKKNYQLVLMLHERNRSGCGEYLERSCLSAQRLLVTPSQDRFYFPLIFLIPPKRHASKIKVQIENEEKQSECVKRFIVDGNEYVLTDLDILKFIHFSEQMRGEQLQRIREQVFSIEPQGEERQQGRRAQLQFDFDEDIYLGE